MRRNNLHVVEREYNFTRQIIHNLILLFFIIITSLFYVFIGYIVFSNFMNIYLIVFSYKKQCLLCFNKINKINQNNFSSHIISNYIY
jgi:hypothetical protein